MSIDLSPFLSPAPFGLDVETKLQRLLPLLQGLTAHHCAACPSYRKIVQTEFGGCEADSIETLPYLPISLFKFRPLRSIAGKDIKVTLRSSGTTGMTRSAVDLDAPTAQRAALALSTILAGQMGGKRLPMLIIDTEEALKKTDGMGARAAAQYVGPGEDVVTIAGTLVPEIAGKFSAIDRIVEMADTGDSWPLMDGTGAILGTYRIETMEVQHIVIMAGGIPRIVDFSIDLKRMDG